MADGKWIHDLTADMPLGEAARRALKVRLQVVRDHLPPAVEHAERDTEHVHQLRVGTRRAAAALHLFESRLPEKTAVTARKRLKRIRRAAAAARDWDVFRFETLARRDEATAAQQAGVNYLLGYAAARRDAAQVDLVARGRKEIRRFDLFAVETLSAVQVLDNDGATFDGLARPVLSQRLHELEESAGGDLKDYVHLHQVRIAGKRLRYAMELFAECFDSSFKDTLYPQIEAMQEILGRANDSHVAGEKLEAIREHGRTILGKAWKPLQSGVTALARFHRQRLTRERRTFLAWWEKWNKNGGPALRSVVEGGMIPGRVRGPDRYRA
jgi:CHAD domain-containing protein